MFVEERHKAIDTELCEKGTVRVKDLSVRFGVTEDCIRKDLKILENQGRLRRIYGGAILSKDYPLEREVIKRKDFHTNRKQRIAAKALEIIKDEETLFLDISTTNIELAKLLVQEDRKVVVVSNMIDILQILVKAPRITVIGTGGLMYENVNGFMGAAAMEVIRQYSFDRAFLGSCGIDFTDNTVTTLGVEDGLTKKSVLKSSRHKYVMMEKEKFYFNESYKYAALDDIDAIITDEQPDATTLGVLDSVGVELYVG